MPREHFTPLNFYFGHLTTSNLQKCNFLLQSVRNWMENDTCHSHVLPSENKRPYCPFSSLISHQTTQPRTTYQETNTPGRALEEMLSFEANSTEIIYRNKKFMVHCRPRRRSISTEPKYDERDWLVLLGLWLIGSSSSRSLYKER